MVMLIYEVEYIFYGCSSWGFNYNIQVKYLLDYVEK